LVAVGANPDRIAILDNFCWCDSKNPKRLGQLKQSTQAAYDFAVAFGTPFISGKDSMFNDFFGYDAEGKELKISVPPTLLISSISVIDDVNKVISTDLKFEGDLIYVLGDLETKYGEVPKVDAKKNLKLYRNFYNCVKKQLLASAVSVEHGGLLVALAKSSMSGLLGIDIDLSPISKTKMVEDILLAESQGCLLVSVDPKKKMEFERLMGINKTLVGKVSQDLNLKVKNGKRRLINVSIKKLLKAYKSTFKNF